MANSFCVLNFRILYYANLADAGLFYSQNISIVFNGSYLKKAL